MPRFTLAAAAAFVASTASAQTPSAQAAPPQAGQAPVAQANAPAALAAERRPVDPGNTLLIETNKGRIVLEMWPEIAPGHVQRIKTLTAQGYYNGALFYRVVKDFVVQTGDKGSKTYKSDLPNLKAEFTFAAKPAAYTAIGDYPATQKAPAGEVGFVGSAPVQLETPTGGPVRGWVTYCPGVAAFAHHADPNSANSQFFIVRTRQPGLERDFTAFGRVVQGMDVVQQITNGEPPPNPDRMTRVRLLSEVPAAERPDVTLLDPRASTFSARVQAAAQAAGPVFSACDIELAPGMK